MGFFIILIVIGVIVFSSYRSGQAAQEQWRQAAQRLNLGYQPGGLGGAGSILGRMNGHRVSVSTFTKGSGNSSRTYTRYQMEYRNAVPVDMKITRQGMLQGMGKVFGMQDIEVGNPAFDDHLLVQGAVPERVRDFLTVEVQSAIRDLAFTYADITITGRHVEISKSGKDGDAAVIVYTVRRLAGFCEAMMDAEGDAEVPDILEVDEYPSATPLIDIEPPEVPYDPLASAQPIVPDPPLVPVEPDEPQFLEETLPEPAEPEPVAVMDEEPELVAVMDEVPEPAKEVETPPNPVEHEAPVVFEPVVLAEAARELFGDSGSTLLSSKLFEERFKNRTVTGSGELTRVGKFSYDPVFINIQGVKATLAVCTLQGTYSKIKVVAEVVFPPDQYDSLQARIGAELPVSGTLIGHDSTMYRLYVDSME